MKPRIFIGSSTQGLRVAELAQSELQHAGEADLWSNGLFRTERVPLENLFVVLDSYDFALFILLPEDPLTLKAKDEVSVRDNVIFELGLFLGRLGRERIFFIAPKGFDASQLYLPSDLNGISPAFYDPNASRLRAAVGTALQEFKETIRTYKSVVDKIILDTDQANLDDDFEFYGNYEQYENGKPVDARGTGHLSVTTDKTIRLKRINSGES